MRKADPVPGGSATVRRHRTVRLEGIWFDVLNHLFMLVMMVSILYPFLYIVALSLSGAGATLIHTFIIPQYFTLENYKSMLQYDYLYWGLLNTLFRTVVGTAMTLVACVLTAYPLSKRYLPFRNTITLLIVFTMFFQGGLIPGYLNIKQLGLVDTRWALILPGLIPSFSMLIMRNYFMSLPPEIEESAKMDGARDTTILARIVVPMSTPIVATVILWTMVGHWNAWFDSMILIRDAKKQVLQIVMRNIVMGGSEVAQQLQSSRSVQDQLGLQAVTPETLKAAMIVITILPIILVYPFLQKYFVKGILVGSLKG